MKFQSTINYMEECVRILSNTANGISDLTRTLRNGAAPAECREDLKVLSEIQKKAVDGLSRESIEFYFKKLDDGGTSVVYLLGCSAFYHPSEDKKDPLAGEEAFFDSLTLTDRLNIKCESVGVPLEQKVKEYSNYMDALKIEDGERWKIFSALLHPEEHKEKIFGLVRHVCEILLKYKEELEEIFQRRLEEIIEENQNKPLETILMDESFYQINQKLLPRQITVTLYDPYALRGVIPFRKEGGYGEGYFTIGAFFVHRPVSAEQKTMEKQDVMGYGKILADGNKLEILRLLSHRNYINRELAKTLKLSTATISYHMSVLTDLDLVNTTISSNKVIYELNRKKMKEVMEGLTEYFEHLEQQ